MIEEGVQQADVYSLLGFSLRKSGDYEKAYSFYRKALEFEPNHKGALEYLGELYVERGEMAKAREHVSVLTRLCPAGCEELEDFKSCNCPSRTRAQNQLACEVCEDGPTGPRLPSLLTGSAL